MKAIRIAGGGLAGLTLGIGLRQKDVPVTILEAGEYPRHRVCGEFISGRAHEVLERLGLLTMILESKPRLAQTVAFFTPWRSSAVRRLPQAGICIERYVLDALLAKRFTELGGELAENHRWKERVFPEGVVRATGRRIQHAERGWRWFGLKAHFLNVELSADLELHLASRGYVGACRLADGRVNVCGLFRRHNADYPSARNWVESLQGAPGSLLRQRFAHAELDESSFCAVAGISLQPQRALASSECRLGDALTMICPMTGNGMSMAFEAAELATGPLAAYSRGELSWPHAQAQVANACDRNFKERVDWAWRLQRMLFLPGFPTLLLPLLSKSDWVWHTTFEKTRSLGKPSCALEDRLKSTNLRDSSS